MRPLRTLALLLLVLGLAGLGALLAGRVLFERPGPPAPEGGEASVVMLEKGLGLRAIARRLAGRGLIADALLFEAGVRLAGEGARLKAGEYAIPSGASMREIMELLASGRSIEYPITIPEGLARKQVLALIAADTVLVGAITLEPEEGALLPETYLFTRGTTRDEILRRMKAAHDSLLGQLWEGRAEGLPLRSRAEAVILASIVEKETGIASERPLVASVFVNRLKRGMRLESDPTIIYGLTGGDPLGRAIRRSELEGLTPYNTYLIDGLPPGPIANPGRASLEAVLNPPPTDYLFFVADGTGGHVFAATLREHERNVAAWRRVERERGLR